MRAVFLGNVAANFFVLSFFKRMNLATVFAHSSSLLTETKCWNMK